MPARPVLTLFLPLAGNRLREFVSNCNRTLLAVGREKRFKRACIDGARIVRPALCAGNTHSRSPKCILDLFFDRAICYSVHGCQEAERAARKAAWEGVKEFKILSACLGRAS